MELSLCERLINGGSPSHLSKPKTTAIFPGQPDSVDPVGSENEIEILDTDYDLEIDPQDFDPTDFEFSSSGERDAERVRRREERDRQRQIRRDEADRRREERRQENDRKRPPSDETLRRRQESDQRIEDSRRKSDQRIEEIRRKSDLRIEEFREKFNRQFSGSTARPKHTLH